MANLLDITGDDIAALGDGDFRNLIGLLCEADYRAAGLSTQGITWGGNQDAQDGGSDVVVRSSSIPLVDGYVPRAYTVFQVKKPDMSRSKIINEMKPKGNLRETIKNLIENKGAYIIASSTGTTTERFLNDRKRAMRDAVSEVDGCDDLQTDFYDRGRIATWVRNHPSLILWVRDKIGRVLHGWKPYDNWANAPEGLAESYILDKGLRLYQGDCPSNEEISVEDGISRLRSELSKPRKSIRLVGLSGVGKTRLVQALFDERIGSDALHSNLAYYTDLSHEPNPEPIQFAEQLIGQNQRAILIVDNCSPELHENLTKLCLRDKSKISLITVEYDVRGDFPEDTSSYKLEPASDALIEQLIQIRFPHIVKIDATRIAKLSGGNARLAIYLSKTVELGERLSSLRENALFDRLFWQTDGHLDPSLLKSAEVLSLVYSFNAEDVSDNSELKILSSLADMSVNELYRNISELQRRNLIQSRGKWRALLPHVLANRLAGNALSSFPPTIIGDAIRESHSERLIKSFSHRLSFLHTVPQAILIAQEWLKADGWLGSGYYNFTPLQMDVFRNIAPVDLETTLTTIERFVEASTSDLYRQNEILIRLLRQLAYDADSFLRCVRILSKFALSETENNNVHSARNTLQSLFKIRLSGTHAPIEMRLRFVEELIHEEHEDKKRLGLKLLNALLQTNSFHSSFGFDFGSRARNYGLYPRGEAVIHWYTVSINACVSFALSSDLIRVEARKILSSHFRGLWSIIPLHELLDESARKMHDDSFWSDGWISVRETIKFLEEPLIHSLDKLEALADYLAPIELKDKVGVYVLSECYEYSGAYDIIESDLSDWGKLEMVAEELGCDVSHNFNLLDSLLPNLIVSKSGSINAFGRGLAGGTEDRAQLWTLIRGAYEHANPDSREINLLMGFLAVCAEKEPLLYHEILDRSLKDNLLMNHIPRFQLVSVFDRNSIERLFVLLNRRDYSVELFRPLHGTHVDEIDDATFSSILEKLLEREGESAVAATLLGFRVLRHKNDHAYEICLVDVAKRILLNYPFGRDDKNKPHDSYLLVSVLRVALSIEDFVFVTRLMESFADHFADNTAISDLYEFLELLVETAPFIFLDTFLEEGKFESWQLIHLFEVHSTHKRSLLSHISDDKIIEWCEVVPKERYVIISRYINPTYRPEKDKPIQFRPIIYVILDKAEYVEPLINNICESIENVSSWTNSLADILDERITVLETLVANPNAAVRELVVKKCEQLKERSSAIRRRETEEQRALYERFEN